MSPRTASSLLIRIDPRAGEPLQRQVYTGIRQAIQDGVLVPGTRLPSSRALASDLGLSRTTTLLALEQLSAEGFLATRRGSGTFVAHDLPEDLPRWRRERPALRLGHLPLSRRGQELAGVRPPGCRTGAGAPRPFRLGVPAVDLFPVKTWAQLAARRLKAATGAQPDYGEAAGYRELREAIAEHVRAARGARCEPDQVLVVAGAQRGLDLMAHLLLDPGDEVWLEEPGYPGARHALMAAGARIVPVPVDGEGLDVEAGARRSARARLAYVTPSHQFPLGACLSLPRRLALLEWASAAGAWIVEDDYDSEFRYGARPVPCLQGLDVDGRVIYVGSFAKTVFPALRLGFLVLPPGIREPVLAARRSADVHPPTLDQVVLADFMREGHYERHLRRLRVAHRERQEALLAAADRYCDGALRLRPTPTGLHLLADVLVAPAEEVAERALARGVEAAALGQHYLGPARTANALALGFGGVHPDAIPAAMQALAAAIEGAAAGPARSGHASRRPSAWAAPPRA